MTVDSCQEDASFLVGGKREQTLEHPQKLEPQRIAIYPFFVFFLFPFRFSRERKSKRDGGTRNPGAGKKEDAALSLSPLREDFSLCQTIMISLLCACYLDC